MCNFSQFYLLACAKILLEEWKNRQNRSPLIVQGARQIGKSWAVTEFGRTHYKHTAVFNFDKQGELKDIFERTKDVIRILGELELYTNVPLAENDTLIFFDEIQECKAALNALKYFKEDAPGYHIIAAGSLLGVAVNKKKDKDGLAEEESDTFPVGKVEFLDMYPVTFREYLRMSDETLMRQVETDLDNLRQAYESALDWLVLSGMVYRIHVCKKPQLPLKHYEDTNAFKVYVLDQAILRTMSELPPKAVIAKGDLLKEFKGAMAENFVLGSLLAQGYKTPHYWTISGNKAEVDFLIQDGIEVRPIEVKAEDNISGQSFKVYQDKYSPSLRLRFSMKNLKVNGNIINIPIFLCDWLKVILASFERD